LGWQRQPLLKITLLLSALKESIPVTALNDQWQAARQLRQEAVAQRRQQVYAVLDGWQQERLINTAKLRQELQQIYVNLQDETTLWLTQARQHRIGQARILRQKLAADQQELEAAVSDLRLEIAQDLQRLQRRVATLRQETAVMRAGHRQEQAILRSQLLPELEAYVSELKADVAAALDALTADRLAAEAPRRVQRQQQRQALAQEVTMLFEELADFRQGLRNFRAELATQVWGQDAAAMPPAPPVQAPAKAPATVTPAAPAPAAQLQPQPQSQPASRRRRVVVKPPAAMPAAQAAAPTATGATAPVETVPAAPVAGVAPAAPEPDAAKSDRIEESIYNYLHKSQGARLTQIESELGINRFQAVDALRSLIQKELIVQEDRIYHIQEEAIL
jgi:hypothetical protein